MSGFATIQRAVLDHPLVGKPKYFHPWCWLFLNACWKPTRFDINGKTVTLQRGQLCASRSQMAAAWGWSESAVERFLTRLQTEQMIGRATGQGRSVITICNYEKYQDIGSKTGQAAEQETGQRPDSDRTAKEQGNQGTRLEEEAKASPSNSAGARFPVTFPKPDWAEDEVWADLLKNRKTRRLTNTRTAHRRFVETVETLAGPEWPPARILEGIVSLGWGGAYDPRAELAKRNQPHTRTQNHDRPTGTSTAAARALTTLERSGHG